MEQDYGILSLLPPVLAIALALTTRQVFLSLAIGIWLGFVILADWNPIVGTFDTIDGVVNVFQSLGDTRIILFTFVVGALIALIQYSGGVQGFVNRVFAWLEKHAETADARGQRRKAELLAMGTGFILFIESNISILTVGTLYRPVFDKLGIPREKLAYITDSSSAPSCILFPLNAWGAYITGLLLAQDLDAPFGEFLKATLFNFYPMAVILIMLFIILTGRDFGPMKRAEIRARETGKLLRDGAVPMIAGDVSSLAAKPGISPKARFMLIPLATMVLLMPVCLIMTGWENSDGNILKALQSGSGSASVLYATSFACIVAMAMGKLTQRMGIRESTDIFLKGMSGMIPLAILMLFAFVLGDLCRTLGTGPYVAELAGAFISPVILPALIFAIACFIAFSTGTSWGTFAIMIPIAVPVAQTLDINLSLAIAAAIGGGVFGDHCSPTSDTSTISSMATASDHIDHVNSQLPYALLGGAITIALYLILAAIGI